MGSICCLSRCFGDNFLKKTATIALTSLAVLSAALSIFAIASYQYPGLVLLGSITLPFCWPVTLLIAAGSTFVFVISCVGLYKLHCSRPSAPPMAFFPEDLKAEATIQNQPGTSNTWEKQIFSRLKNDYSSEKIQKALKDIQDRELEVFSKARREGNLEEGVELVRHFCSWDSKKNR